MYDSVLAAYRTLRASYKDDMVNTLIVLTDGKNEDTKGVKSLDALVKGVGKLSDRARPIPVIFLGMGDGVDPAEMKRIADATGGEFYIAKNPADVGDVFRESIGRRVCRPNC
jgi:Ca-activated chloride channel family protein